MPEGDTIHRLAARLAPLLRGETLRRVDLWGRRAPSLEREVDEVRALGKHLLIELESGECIRTHLGLNGTWRGIVPAERGEEGLDRQGVGSRVSALRLVSEAGVFECFGAEIADTFPVGRRLSVPGLRDLGPDLLGEREPEWQRVVARARHFVPAHRPVADLLLDQRVAAGIGNVYKSELQFLFGVLPQTPAGELDAAVIEQIYRRARLLLQSNLGPWLRTTTVDRRSERLPRGQPRLYVYGRGGRACLRCASPIQSRRLGHRNRPTYWCARCQRN